MNNKIKALILAIVIAGIGILVFMSSRESDKKYETPEISKSKLADVEEKVEVVKGPPVPLVEAKVVDVRGTVKDDAGTALPGVKIVVYATSSSGTSINKKKEKETRSDTEGGFRIEKLRAGKYEFVARQPGYQEARLVRVIGETETPDSVDFVLNSGLAISGYTKDSFNKVIAGALVTAFVERVEKNATLEEKLQKLVHFQEIKSEEGIQATSNEEGWYQIVGLERSDYRVRAIAGSYAPHELRHVPAGTTDANFFLEPGGLLTGTVTSKQGVPIEGARVSAYRAPGDTDKTVDIFDTVLFAIMPPTAQRETDVDGRFALDELGGGEQFRLTVRAPGFQDDEVAKVVVEPGDNAEINISLDVGLVLEGVVYDPNGGALEGATVKVNLQGGRPKSHDIQDEGFVTESDGRFFFDTLEDGNYRIVASHPDYASVQENRVKPAQGISGEEIELRLTVGGAISGYITDSSAGSPVPGATISVRDIAGIEKEAVSDSSGSYLVRGISVPRKKQAMLSVEAEEYARVSNEQIPVEEGVVSEGYDFALDRNGQVSGFVRDASGNPVTGCQVTVKRQFSPTTPVIVSVGTVVVSDASGRFEVTGVAPGEGSFLEGSHPEFLSSSSDSFVVEPGQTLQEQVLTMQRGGAISGVIVDESGTPIEAAVVGVQGEYQYDQPVSSMRKHADTDEGGNFSLSSLEAESHTLVAEAEGYLRTKLTGVSVVEGRTSQGVRITLVKSSFVAGYVTDTADAPIRNAKVTIFDSAEGLRRIPVRTDTNGAFRCDELGPYEVDIEAEAPGYTKVRITGQAVNSEGVHLALEKMGSITGRVMDDEGKPVRAFSVSPKKYMDGRVLPKVPAKTFQTTDGTFEYPGIEPGQYEVVIGAPGYTVEKVEGISVQSDFASNVGTVTLRQGGKLGGRVIDAQTGEPIYAATVTILGGERSLMPPVPDVGRPQSGRNRRNMVRTDREGFFKLQGLNVDGVSVRIEHREFLAMVEHNLPAGAQDLIFEMSRGGMIEGRVVDGNGEPLSGRQVLLTGGNNRSDRQVTDRKGTFIFSGLAAGDYTLRATQVFMKGEAGAGKPHQGGRGIRDAPMREVQVDVGVITEVEIVIPEV